MSTTRNASPHIPLREVKAAIFWDFDGTVYRAPAGCRRYGQEIAKCLPPDQAGEYLATLDRYLAGEGGIEAADGWEAAAKAAGEYLGRNGWHEEFRNARTYLESGDCPIEVPAGLRETISRLRRRARQFLLSNTPSFGVFGLLSKLGIADLFDEVVCEAGKPALLPARLSAAARVLGLPVGAVLSVGDHFQNDVAPALAAGAAGAYVNTFGAGPSGIADLEAPKMELLLPAIERWVTEYQNQAPTPARESEQNW